MKPRFALLVLVAAALAVLTRFVDAGALLQAALLRVHGLGFWAPAAFVATYILACVLFMPGAVLTIGAGALFGLLWGTVYVSIGSVLGATAAFLIARHLARDWVSEKLRGDRKFAAISAAVTRKGWIIVGLTRLSPVFPFNLLNYAFGVTEVHLRDYIVASWIAMLPGTVLYVYIGSLAGDLASLGTGSHARTPAGWGLYGAGLLATAAVSVYVTRIARAALEEETLA